MSEGGVDNQAIKFKSEPSEIFAGGRVRIYNATGGHRENTRTEIDTLDGMISILRTRAPYSEAHGRILIQRRGEVLELLQIRNPIKGKGEYDFYSGDELVGKGKGSFDIFIAQKFIEGVDPNLVNIALRSRVDPEVTRFIAEGFARHAMSQS